MSNAAVLNPSPSQVISNQSQVTSNHSPRLTLDQVGEMIVKESRKSAEKAGYKYRLDVDEMESWLISEIYHEVMKNKSMQNIKGIRHMLRLRSVDFIRELARDNVSMNFSSMTLAKNFEGDREFYKNEEVLTNFQVKSTEDSVLQYADLRGFLDTLELQDRQIVELSAGITDSLDDYQIARVKDMIDKKAICKCGSANCQHNVNVWLTTSEVGEILGLSRRQVQYPLSKMSEKALDFGLWF